MTVVLVLLTESAKAKLLILTTLAWAELCMVAASKNTSNKMPTGPLFIAQPRSGYNTPSDSKLLRRKCVSLQCQCSWLGSIVGELLINYSESQAARTSGKKDTY